MTNQIFVHHPQFSSYFFYVSLVTGILIIVSLLTHGFKSRPNLILVALIFANLIHQYSSLLLALYGRESYRLLLRSGRPLGLLSASLLYLYIVALTDRTFAFNKKFILKHFGVFIVAFAWYLGFALFEKSFTDLKALEDMPYLIPEIYSRRFFTAFVSGIYIFFSFKSVRLFRKSAPDFRSDLTQIRLKWLYLVLVFFTLYWLIILVRLIRQPLGPIWLFQPQVLGLGYLCIAVAALRTAPIFNLRTKNNETDPLEKTQESRSHSLKTKEFPPAERRYSDEELSRWGERLQEFMERNAPYLDPRLRLSDMSQAIGIKPQAMSEVLNRHFGVNFFTFVNRYRIEEAKRRLSDPKYDYMNIMGIATECGFNSKSAFNETFRLMTGTTPSSFRSKQRLSSKPV